MTTEVDDAVNYLYTHGKKYAEAKAHRVYLEQFLKSQKAILMKKAIADGVAKSSASAEMEAYSDPVYVDLLKALQIAVEAEEAIKWSLVSAQARIEVYRTQSANDRAMDRGAM